MNQRLLIFILILLYSCNSKQSGTKGVTPAVTMDSGSKQTSIPAESKKQATIADPDTTSLDYLLQLVQNDKPLNSYWANKLDSLKELYLPPDSPGQLEIVRNWQINDSISVIIIRSSGGTYNLEYLLTIKNKHIIINEIEIGDNCDSDLSPDQPYRYTEYKIIDDRKIKLVKHKVTGTEGSDENDRIISIENYTLQNSGKITKK